MYLLKYKHYLKEKNYSEVTYCAYVRNSENFLNYLNQNSITLDNLEKKHCLDYIMGLSTLGYSKPNLNLITSSLTNFFNYLMDYHNFNHNYFKSIKKYKPDKKMPFIYDINDVLNNVKKIKNVKDRLIVILILTTGMTVDDLINLEISNIDLEISSINLKKSKVPRKIYFDYLTNEYLIFYLSKYKLNKFLFEKNNQKMKKSQILSILEKSNVFSEIIKTTPSRLKTVFASEMLKNGIDMMTLKVLLGASSVTAIEKYKKSNFQHLLDIANKKHPLHNYTIKRK